MNLDFSSVLLVHKVSVHVIEGAYSLSWWLLQSVCYYTQSWLPTHSIVVDCISDRTEAKSAGKMLTLKYYCRVRLCSSIANFHPCHLSVLKFYDLCKVSYYCWDGCKVEWMPSGT